MKRFTTTLMILAILLTMPLAVFAAQVGKITNIEGNVDITAGEEKARTANLGDAINSGDILRAKSKAKAEVTFTDGNILRLAENTRVRVTDYQTGEGKTSTLDLFRGKTQSVVSGLAKDARYEVRTPTAICGVRGTDFIAFFQNGVSGFVPREGTIYGYNRNMPQDVKVVTPGQAIVVTAANKPATVQPATSSEMQKHMSDTAPTEKKEEQEKKEEGAAPANGGGSTPARDVAAGPTPSGFDVVVTEPLPPTATSTPTPAPTPTPVPPPQPPLPPQEPVAFTTDLAGQISRMMEGTVRDTQYMSLYRIPSTVTNYYSGGGYSFWAASNYYKTVRYESMYFQDTAGAVNLGYRFEQPEYATLSADGKQLYQGGLNVWYWPNRSFFVVRTHSPIDSIASRGRAFAPDYRLPNLDLSAATPVGGTSGNHPYFPGTLGDAASFPADYAINSATSTDPYNLWGHGTFVKTLDWSIANANSREEIGTFSGSLDVKGSDKMTLFATSTSANQVNMSLLGNYAQEAAYTDIHGTLGYGADLSGYVPTTTGYGGAYYGQFQGRLPDTGSTVPLQGNLYALYIYNPDATTNRAGIIYGKLTEGASSTTDPGTRKWQAEGKLYRLADPDLEKDLTEAGENPAGVTAANLAANIISGRGSVEGTAGFYTPTSATDATVALGMGRVWFPSVKGFNKFGLFFMSHDFMNYSNGAPATATWESAGWGEFGGYIRSDNSFYYDLGYWYATLDNKSWADNKLSAAFNGRFLTLMKYGAMTGDTSGSYGDTGLWVASSQGYWQKSGQNGGDLAFASMIEGQRLQLDREQWGSYTATTVGTYPSYEYWLSDPNATERRGSSTYYNGGSAYTVVKFDRQGPSGRTYIKESWTTADNGTTWTYATPVYYADEAAYNAALNGMTTPPAGPSWGTGDLYDQYYIGTRGFDGILGGLNANLWTEKTSPILLQGTYDWMGATNQSLSPSLAMGNFVSINPVVNINPWANSTSRIDGAYRGILGLAIDSQNSLSGGLMALYRDPSGYGGVLYSDELVGIIHPKVGAWSAEGTLYAYPITSSPLSGSAATFAQTVVTTDTSIPYYSYMYYPVVAKPISGGTIDMQAERRIVSAIPDEPWNIWSMTSGGTYSDATPERWVSEVENRPLSISGGGYGSDYLSVNMGAPVNGISTGNVAGAHVLFDDPQGGTPRSYTVVVGGLVKGLFDPATTPMKWQAIAQGGDVETSHFLAGQAAMDDAAKASFERAMKIPSFDVGMANLSGSNGNLNVGMNNIKFFRFQNEATPRIWATGDAGGTYSTNPASGTKVTLTAGSGDLSGLTHTFEVKQWNTTTNNWGASLYKGTGDTGGTLTRSATDAARTLPAGASSTIPITEMRGGAAGTIVPNAASTGGTFGGTAAGTVR